MKKTILTLLCFSVTAIAANAQDKKPQPATAPVAAAAAPVPDKNAGKFEFKEETHDYGEVPEGPLAETDFQFKNVGKSPIVISEVHGSCGCTVPSWPKEPILPGKTASIHVTYNTNGRVGPIMKDVIINSNAQQSPMTLHIRGTVKAKPAAEATQPTPAAH